MNSNENLNELIKGLRTTKIRIGFFDIETQYSFQDLYPEWDQISWKKKNELFPQLITKLKIAIAGLLIIEPEKREPSYLYFEEGAKDQLMTELSQLDVIIGHNLIGFDYKVLNFYFPSSQIRTLEEKTIDTLRSLQKATSQFIALDDLGRLNLNLTKTTNSREIPEMWRNGQFEEVTSYLKRDLELNAGIFAYVLKNKKLVYPHKYYGKFVGNRVVQVNWANVISTDLSYSGYN